MANFCTNCGAQLDDDMRFCTSCGTQIAEGGQSPAPPPADPTPAPVETPIPAPVPTPAPVQTSISTPIPTPPPVYDGKGANTRIQSNEIPGKKDPYAPITTGGFIGIALLMAIPVIGLIFTIVWACGGCRKINKRNFARASLILLVIGLVLTLAVGLVARGFIMKTLEAVGLGSQNTDLTDFFGDQSDDDTDITGMDIVGGLLTEGDASDGKDIGDLLEDVEDINERAEAVNDGWPKSLRPYPGGSATAVASYRTEIRETDAEEMKAYIAMLKKDGYAFKDFYDFGLSEEDMLGMDSWWGTDGEIYVSMSYYDGVLTIDHTTELPDLADYFS